MRELADRRKCKTCQEFFPKTTNYFYPHSKCKDGLLSHCIKCVREKNRQSRIKNTPTKTVCCLDCDLEMVRRIDTLKKWQGRCRSCAQKIACNTPEAKQRKSESAKRQLAKQGGVPNARKFTSPVTPENHPHWKGGKPKCQNCGIECSAYTSLMCLPCRMKHRPQGEDHPRWKGGVTPENHKIRTSTAYKEWRMSVFRRDRFSCVMCGHRSKSSGKKPCDIRADHIKPFHLFPDLRLDVDNGRTLCIPCDKKHGYNFIRDRQILLFG